MLLPDPADPRLPRTPMAHTPGLTGVALRRTTTTDILRPEGLRGPAVVRGSGRDLLVAPETADPEQPSPGAGVVTVTASIDVRTDDGREPVITGIEASPWHEPIGGLVGRGASAGFRAQLPGVLRDEPAGSLLWRLLTEVPNLFVIGGFSLQYERVPLGLAAGQLRTQTGLCAGFRAGGTMMVGLETTGMVPYTRGPVAPPVVPPGEPLGWHDEPELPAHAVRRRRRIDLRHGGAGAHVWFRDSYQPPDDHEMVIHEYTIDLTLTGVPATIATMAVTPHVLPWIECPDAAASALRMVGERLDAVAARGRRELHGVTTCTHLNAAVGSIADLDAMLSVLTTVRDG
jgi:hypothetical protein